MLDKFLDMALMPGLTALISGFVAWFFSRKKERVELDGANISNMQNALSFYTTIIADNKVQTDKLSELNKSLFLENLQLRQKISELQVEMNELKIELANIKRQVDSNSQKLM